MKSSKVSSHSACPENLHKTVSFPYLKECPRGCSAASLVTVPFSWAFTVQRSCLEQRRGRFVDFCAILNLIMLPIQTSLQISTKPFESSLSATLSPKCVQRTRMSSVLLGRRVCVTSVLRIASSATALGAASRKALILPTLRHGRCSLAGSRSNCHRGVGVRTTAPRRRHASTTLSGGKKLASPSSAAGAGADVGAGAAKVDQRRLSKIGSNNKAVAAWLFGTAGAVAGMVTVGGITRMTRSGLSMTDWKIQGSLPPSSEVRLANGVLCARHMMPQRTYC